MKTVFFLLICLISTTSVSSNLLSSSERQQFNTNTAVEIQGKVSRGMYLSKYSDSEFEYMNESYYLDLENEINVKDLRNNNKIHEGISSIEISENFTFEFHSFYGKQVVIKGKLQVFREASEGDYTRQYSTPVYIEPETVTEIMK